MCKLLIATGKITRDNAIKLIESAHDSFYSSQRDGFGFVAYGPDGLASGHYLTPSDYVGHKMPVPKFVQRNIVETGTIPKIVSALLVHGRTSTNSVQIENVHPFQRRIGKRNNVWMVHNGILRWIGEGIAPVARHGCDSEQFLNWIADHGSKQIPESVWNECNRNWSGYGVFGILEPEINRLSVVKCGSGHLSWLSNCPSGLHLFSTQSGDVERAGKAIGIKGSGMRVQSKSISTFSLFPQGGSKLASVRSWSGFGDSVRDDLWDRSMGLVTRKTEP